MSDFNEATAFPHGLSPLLTRRELLGRSFNGLGALALGGLLADELGAEIQDPLAPRAPHTKRRAKHCIFLFMAGGVSQMDSFEYKPVLNQLHGKRLSRIPTISGELQGSTDTTWIIARETAEAGLVHIHFPKIGYTIKAL